MLIAAQLLRNGLRRRVFGRRQGANSSFALLRRDELEATRPGDSLHDLGKQRLADGIDR